MALNNLRDLLYEQLQGLYDAEQQLTKALPMMAEAASNPTLKQGFERHLEETQNQVKRLEQAFDMLGQEAKSKTCKAMQGLIAEGQEVMKEKADPDVKDAALIAAAQRIEHYEIAGYGSVATMAKQLGDQDVAELLGQTLQEEKLTDERLTQVAESSINQNAANQ